MDTFLVNINDCDNLQQLSNLVANNNVGCVVGKFGGRYFFRVDASGVGRVSLNDIVKRFNFLYSSQVNKSIRDINNAERIIKTIENLNRAGNELLATQSCFIRALTSLRQSLGNRNFDRNGCIKLIQEGCDKAKESGRLRALEELQRKNEAEKEKVKKEKELKQKQAEEARKVRQKQLEEQAQRDAIKRAEEEKLAAAKRAADHAAKLEKEQKLGNEKNRLSGLSVCQLIREYPILTGHLQEENLFSSSLEKQAYYANLLCQKINSVLPTATVGLRSYLNTTNHFDRQMEQISETLEDQPKEKVRHIFLQIAKHSNLPIFLICQILYNVASPKIADSIKKELVEKIAIQIERRGLLINENAEAQKKTANGEMVTFKYISIELNGATVFPHCSNTLPSKDSLELLAEAFFIVFKQQVKIIQEKLRSSSIPITIDFPTKNNLWLKEFIQIFDKKMQAIAREKGVVSMSRAIPVDN